MNRIATCLGSLNHKLLIPFFTVGYPDIPTSLDLVKVAVDAGADIVELGMPFSDPLADGPAIQYSSQVALEKGSSVRQILTGVRKLRQSVTVGLVLMGYLNPIIAYGEAKFTRAAQKTGVDGLIIPDLPIDARNDLATEAGYRDLSMIYLVAPTTTRERLTQIDLHTTGFVYAVTVTGVTGTDLRFDEATDRYLRQMKRMLSKPFVAGFGVSSIESAQRLCRHADGVVIGSALVRIIREATSKHQARERVGRFLRQMRRAI